jgi:mannosyl-3-phosphoglycerate phosphatase
MGDNDKGRAAAILIELFRRKSGELKTVGLGDSLNDLPLLSVVDIPILVQKPGGYWEEMKLPNLWRIEGIGPEGFGRAIEEL